MMTLRLVQKRKKLCSTHYSEYILRILEDQLLDYWIFIMDQGHYPLALPTKYYIIYILYKYKIICIYAYI